MNSYEKLIYVLEPIKIYDLSNEESLICKELSTYACALENIEEKANEMIKELFLETAVSVGLKRFKCVYAADEFTADASKEYIGFILKGHYAFWNPQAWIYELEQLQPDAVFSSEFANFSFKVDNFSTLSTIKESKAVAIARKYIPCHLAFNFHLPFRTWNEFESASLSFTQLQSLALTYNEMEMFD